MFWQDSMPKKRTLSNNFSQSFSSCSSLQKTMISTLFLPPLINLNSTFCLSQSLPQSCNTKNWGGCLGPQKAVNYGVLWTYHAFYLPKNAPPPPQLKLTCVSAPRKTRPFAPTVRADLTCHFSRQVQHLVTWYSKLCLVYKSSVV